MKQYSSMQASLIIDDDRAKMPYQGQHFSIRKLEKIVWATEAAKKLRLARQLGSNIWHRQTEVQASIGNISVKKIIRMPIKRKKGLNELAINASYYIGYNQ